MLTCYVTRPELQQFCNIENYVATDDVIDASLGTAAYTLAETLRGRGIDPSRVQVPTMFEAVAEYEAIRYLAGEHTTTSVKGGNASRLVLDLRTEVTSPVTVRLEGSQDETTWRTVHAVTGRPAVIEAQADGIASVLFVARHAYYRAVLESSETVDAALYLVDTAPDACIRWGAVASALLPAIDSNTTIERVYAEARMMYDDALGKLVLDYDRDGDGTIDTHESSYRTTIIRAFR